MLTDMDIILRYVASTVIGIAIGYSRRGYAAGARTFALISLGATIFTVIAISPFFIENYPAAATPIPVIAQIIAGIGFIGLGVIWRHGAGKPAGLTTAAAIWVTAAIGVLAGLGMWVEVGAGTLLTLAVIFSKPALHKAKVD